MMRRVIFYANRRKRPRSFAGAHVMHSRINALQALIRRVPVIDAECDTQSRAPSRYTLQQKTSGAPVPPPLMIKG
jgi:hypothetical protein